MKFKQRRFNRKKKRGEKNKNNTQTKTKTKQKQKQKKKKEKRKKKKEKRNKTKKQKRDLPPLTHPTLLPSIMFSSNYVVARDIICRLSALRYPANTL